MVFHYLKCQVQMKYKCPPCFILGLNVCRTLQGILCFCFFPFFRDCYWILWKLCFFKMSSVWRPSALASTSMPFMLSSDICVLCSSSSSCCLLMSGSGKQDKNLHRARICHWWGTFRQNRKRVVVRPIFVCPPTQFVSWSYVSRWPELIVQWTWTDEWQWCIIHESLDFFCNQNSWVGYFCSLSGKSSRRQIDFQRTWKPYACLIVNYRFIKVVWKRMKPESIFNSS